MKNAAEIEALLLRAFPVNTPPSPDEVTDKGPSERCLERDAISKLFGSKQWTEISWQSLNEEYSGDPAACLGFMSHDAFRYFLPAYLRLCVLLGLDADATYDYTINHLTPSKSLRSASDFETVFSEFTEEQNQAIASVLLHLSRLDKERASWDDASDALDEYWRKFVRH